MFFLQLYVHYLKKVNSNKTEFWKIIVLNKEQGKWSKFKGIQNGNIFRVKKYEWKFSNKCTKTNLRFKKNSKKNSKEPDCRDFGYFLFYLITTSKQRCSIFISYTQSLVSKTLYFCFRIYIIILRLATYDKFKTSMFD